MCDTHEHPGSFGEGKGTPASSGWTASMDHNSTRIHLNVSFANPILTVICAALCTSFYVLQSSSLWETHVEFGPSTIQVCQDLAKYVINFCISLYCPLLELFFLVNTALSTESTAEDRAS
jgi:hypothetical protein